jgi:tetratricopeptide (TPR) repeat protein
MNKEVFIKLVLNSQEISPDDLEALEELARIFPYCGLAHMLVSKSHFEQASMLASQKLRRAAVYATHRDTLKKLLLGDELPSTEKQDLIAQPMLTIEPETLEELVIEPVDGIYFQNYIQHLQQQTQSAPHADEELEGEPPLQLGHLNDDDTEIENFSKRLKKNVQREIIENFIKLEPRISSLNFTEKDAYTDRDLSEKSIALPQDMASENMANILVRQGKIEKAIFIYEQLILKNPQKKDYFASRIEDLKNL